MFEFERSVVSVSFTSSLSLSFFLSQSVLLPVNFNDCVSQRRQLSKAASFDGFALLVSRQLMFTICTDTVVINTDYNRMFISHREWWDPSWLEWYRRSSDAGQPRCRDEIEANPDLAFSVAHWPEVPERMTESRTPTVCLYETMNNIRLATDMRYTQRVAKTNR